MGLYMLCLLYLMMIIAYVDLLLKPQEKNLNVMENERILQCKILRKNYSVGKTLLKLG